MSHLYLSKSLTAKARTPIFDKVLTFHAPMAMLLSLNSLVVVVVAVVESSSSFHDLDHFTVSSAVHSYGVQQGSQIECMVRSSVLRPFIHSTCQSHSIQIKPNLRSQLIPGLSIALATKPARTIWKISSS